MSKRNKKTVRIEEDARRSVQRAEIVHDLDLLKALMLQAHVEWIVIHSNPKCELRALEGLHAKGILGYLPREKVDRVDERSGKKYSLKRPLFRSYLFAGIDQSKGQTADCVRSCDGVAGILKAEENARPVRVLAKDLTRVMDVAHGTFEGVPLPDEFLIKVANLESGCTLQLVKGHWSGFDFTFSAYDEAKAAVHGEINTTGGAVRISTPVDAIAI